MVLYKNGIALSPEEEARQMQEQKDTGTYQMGVSAEQPTNILQGVKDVGSNILGGIKTGLNTMFNPTPTVATKTNPIVDKETIGQQKPVLNFNKDTYLNVVSKDPSKITEDEKAYLRKIQAQVNMGQSLNSVLGIKDTTTTTTTPTADFTASEKEIADKKAQLAEITKQKADIRQKEIDDRVSKEIAAVEESGRKQIEAVKSSMAFSGFGRSNLAVQKQDEVTKAVQDRIESAKTLAAKEMDLYRMQLEGADAETIAGMQKDLSKAKLDLQAKQEAAAIEMAKLNKENGVKGQEALNNFLSMYTGDTKKKLESEGYDEKLSAKLGYAVDKFGKPLTVDGKRLEFTGEEGVSDAIESYAQEIYKGNANISSVPDDKRDAVINRVSGLRNENKTSSSSLNEFKAEKILKTILKRTIDKQKDAAYLSFVSNMIDKGYSEDQIYNELGAADLKQTDFVAGNQKLFDDMKKDTADFSLLKGTYKNLDAIVKDAIASGDETSKASADQALITLYNKMLDPGSVVREGEYDRTSQGQSILSQAAGYLSRLQQGGAAITDDTRKDMVRIAGILYKQAEKGIELRKKGYEEIAADVGGDADFVRRYFNNQLDKANLPGTIFKQDEESALQGIFGPTQGETGSFKSSSGKSFNIPGFKSAELPAGTKGVDFSVNTDLINKYPNEASFKNNNPTGITYKISQKTKDLLAENGITYDEGTSRPSNEGGKYIKFPDVGTGLKAYEVLLTKAGTDDIYNRLKQWVGTSNGDNYANEIMTIAGIKKGTKFSELTPEELEKLKQVQLKRESPAFYKELYT